MKTTILSASIILMILALFPTYPLCIAPYAMGVALMVLGLVCPR